MNCWAGPDDEKTGSEGGHPVSFDEIVALIPPAIRARAEEARRIDRARGHRQLAFGDDPYSFPLAHANPCTDKNGKPVYAIWCDGEPVGLAESWTDACHTVRLLCMHFRSVGPQDLLAATSETA